MKISRDWLQSYFEKPLPSAHDLANALTFHAFEIESVENDILDVKVTPNRGHDCLSYRGIAKEVSAILRIPLVADPHAELGTEQQFTFSMPVSVSIKEPMLCSRYIAWSIKGVKVAPSPKWLADRLAAMGQQSINNVVDITNFVMFSSGQPLHAFDAGQLKLSKDGYAISVRKAKQDEKIIALDDKEYALKDSMLVIVDAHTDGAIGIAGVKGGKPAGISEKTKNIIIESACFNGVSVRKTAAALKLRTDASARFEQVISPEMAGLGMRMAVKYILELAGGELASFSDEYPSLPEKRTVRVSLQKINAVLGTALSKEDAEDAFTRLALPSVAEGEVFTVTVPAERIDISIPEDLVEEVGRLIGYHKVPSIALPKFGAPEVNQHYYAQEKMREDALERGYSEIFTSVFADSGKMQVLNKVDSVRPYLRASLKDGLAEAYEKNLHYVDLLGLDEVKLFEIGAVWSGEKEEIVFGMVDKQGVKVGPIVEAKVDSYDDLPVSATVRYESFSKYPAIVRDVALWVFPDKENALPSAESVQEIIRSHAGDLLVRISKFDEFKKAEKMSYAFRLVFQSFDRTLFDGDANERMESIYAALREKGWEVR
jgi:phenylalanyl-tRNA synthetase beta chain